MQDDYIRQAAVVMSAIELLPAQPSDLTNILRDPDQLDALLDPGSVSYETELVGYLRRGLRTTRIEYWSNEIAALHERKAARPILASNPLGSPSYPHRLFECWDAPPILFASADLKIDQPAVAIIGSRDVGAEVVQDTRDLASNLAADGAAIISGLALGVDAAAHEGALDVNGFTVAVLGTGITQVYPAQNAELAEKIRASGVMVSQYAPYAPRTRTSFLQRNHVIAGLTDVSIVMSGEARSGSRHEIRQAIGYGRAVLMWAPALANQRWAQNLAETGDATFVQNFEEVRYAIERAVK
jgi:DNA processing protein